MHLWSQPAEKIFSSGSELQITISEFQRSSQQRPYQFFAHLAAAVPYHRHYLHLIPVNKAVHSCSSTVNAHKIQQSKYNELLNLLPQRYLFQHSAASLCSRTYRAWCQCHTPHAARTDMTNVQLRYIADWRQMYISSTHPLLSHTVFSVVAQKDNVRLQASHSLVQHFCFCLRVKFQIPPRWSTVKTPIMSELEENAMQLRKHAN